MKTKKTNEMLLMCSFSLSFSLCQKEAIILVAQTKRMTTEFWLVSKFIAAR